MRIENDNAPAIQPTSLRLRIMPTQGGSAIILPMQADLQKSGEWFASGMLAQTGGYYVHIEGDQPLQSIFATILVEKPERPATAP